MKTVSNLMAVYSKWDDTMIPLADERMMNDLERSEAQIYRAAKLDTSLSDVRLGPAVVLSYEECRKLSHETTYSIEQLRSEFIGYKDGWEDFREALEEFKREVGKPCLRIVDWLGKKLA